MKSGTFPGSAALKVIPNIRPRLKRKEEKGVKVFSMPCDSRFIYSGQHRKRSEKKNSILRRAIFEFERSFVTRSFFKSTMVEEKRALAVFS